MDEAKSTIKAIGTLDGTELEKVKKDFEDANEAAKGAIENIRGKFGENKKPNQENDGQPNNIKPNNDTEITTSLLVKPKLQVYTEVWPSILTDYDVVVPVAVVEDEAEPKFTIIEKLLGNMFAQ